MNSSNKTAGADESQIHRFSFNTGFGFGFIAFSIILFAIIPTQIDKPLIVLPGSENELQPTLFPQLIAAGFGLLGIWLSFRSFSIRETNEVRLLARSAVTNVCITLAVMALYGPVMMMIGFVVSSALVISILSTFFGNRNYALTAVVSIGVPVAIYYTFTKILVTYLPPFPVDTLLTRLSIL